MLVSALRRLPTARRSLQQALLQKVRLVHVLDRPGIFSESGRDRLDAYGPAPKLLDDRTQDRSIDTVQAQVIDFQTIERVVGDVAGNHLSALDLGEISNAPKEAVRDSGCAASPAGNLAGAVGLDRVTEDSRRAGENLEQGILSIELEVEHDAKSVSQRTGQQTLTGGCSDHGECGQVEPDGAGRRALTHQDIDLLVLHRGIQDLLDRPRQPVDLVDEEHGACFEVGKDTDQITGTLDGGPAGDMDRSVHLGCDDVGESGFPQARRTIEKEMVERFTALPSGAEEDGQIVLDALLADELAQPSWPEG